MSLITPSLGLGTMPSLSDCPFIAYPSPLVKLILNECCSFIEWVLWLESKGGRWGDLRVGRSCGREPKAGPWASRPLGRPPLPCPCLLFPHLACASFLVQPGAAYTHAPPLGQCGEASFEQVHLRNWTRLYYYFIFFFSYILFISLTPLLVSLFLPLFSHTFCFPHTFCA